MAFKPVISALKHTALYCTGSKVLDMIRILLGVMAEHSYLSQAWLDPVGLSTFGVCSTAARDVGACIQQGE